MSFYGIEADQIKRHSRRKVQLSEKFGNAVHKVIGVALAT